MTVRDYWYNAAMKPLWADTDPYSEAEMIRLLRNASGYGLELEKELREDLAKKDPC